ncbi:hypothetical protein E2C01_075889 [Portunus trituberculatus]|uniref:Uncharacterized protein n=1 Tax=Portunus trituberculatus TaxID=210409 RepID=A0A5B7IBU8_PORTR|nr:hypothetical protein [Portunus trituberculatus]
MPLLKQARETRELAKENGINVLTPPSSLRSGHTRNILTISYRLISRRSGGTGGKTSTNNLNGRRIQTWSTFIHFLQTVDSLTLYNC